jgi:hypothetical protein
VQHIPWPVSSPPQFWWSRTHNISELPQVADGVREQYVGGCDVVVDGFGFMASA